jgi:hypothetical protein
LGRVGFLTKFANIIEDQIKNENEAVVQYFKENEAWKEYVENSLKETNKVEKDK